MQVTIVFEDGEMLAVNKPSGMVVNKADTTKGVVTLQDWAEEYLRIPQGSLNHERDDFINRGGIVHRLDKETSGILLLAKTEKSFYALQGQFKERTTEKTYKALVHGVVVPQNGEIAVPVGRLPWNRMRFGVVADGREAVTRYETDAIYMFKGQNKERLSLLTVYPKTGRTHQIRVHLKHINHPIFSDFLYAGRKTARDDRQVLDRVFLHAYSIAFTHPVSGESMTLTAPLAPELEEFLRNTLEIVVVDEQMR
jgi:23S rRNA pseudouridine1911/1915/1917 synthase